VILQTIRETGLSRFPVYNEDMDDIIGTLNTRVFLLNMQTEHPRTLREMIREAYFVPSTVQADMLFRNMQMKKIHMAIVIDEYGGMAGIVTMEDLLEEIVGNIYDEFDPQAEAEIVRVNDDTWRISGQAALEDVADALDVELPTDEDYDTLGGLIFSQFTLIPEDGSQPEVDCHGLHIVVEKIEDHRVEMAVVTKLPEETAADADDDHKSEDDEN
jgi:putative hemolysin